MLHHLRYLTSPAQSCVPDQRMERSIAGSDESASVSGSVSGTSPFPTLLLLLLLPHHGQRPLLDHQSHHLKQDVRRRHRRQLGIRIVRRRHLDNVRAHEIHPLQPPDDRPQLPRAPPARLRRPRRGRERRIQGIDVDAQVDGVVRPDAIADRLDDARCADGVDVPRLDAAEATIAVVGVVAQPGQGGADPGVDVGVVGQQALLAGVVEVGAVVDGGLFTWGAAEHAGFPGVEVGVEVDYGDGAVGFVDGAEEGEGDGVVAP